MKLDLPLKYVSKSCHKLRLQINKKASYNISSSSNDVPTNKGKYAPIDDSNGQRHAVDTNNQHTSENNCSFLKGLIRTINKKASYNISNSSNDVSTKNGKYTPIDDSNGQIYAVDTNNQHTSENSAGGYIRSYSFDYIESLGTTSVCTQLQKNDYDYDVIEDEQCNIPEEQIERLLQKYSSLKRCYRSDQTDISLTFSEIKEHNHCVNDNNGTIQSIGEHVETDAI